MHDHECAECGEELEPGSGRCINVDCRVAQEQATAGAARQTAKATAGAARYEPRAFSSSGKVD